MTHYITYHSYSIGEYFFIKYLANLKKKMHQVTQKKKYIPFKNYIVIRYRSMLKSDKGAVNFMRLILQKDRVKINNEDIEHTCTI